MKAIVQDRYGTAEHLVLSDLPVPKPGKGQVRVRVRACAVNLSDWEYLTGKPFYARMVGGLFRPKYPVLGSDIVGTIDAIGEGVSGFSIGDRVMGDFVMRRGGFAEFACIAADEMTSVPEALSDEVAACLPQAGGIAVAGTEGLAANDTLLINGAGGGSGTMALQLAKSRGAKVTAVDNRTKVDWLSELGADEVFDYARQDFTETGKQWHRILDMVATHGPGKIAKALEKGGQYKAVGGEIRVLCALLLGGLPYRLAHKKIGMLLVPSGRALTERVARMAVEGKIAPLIEDVLPLSATPEALRRTGLGQVKGKLVIRPFDT